MGMIVCPHCEREIELEWVVCPRCCGEVGLVRVLIGLEEYYCSNCGLKITTMRTERKLDTTPCRRGIIGQEKKEG